MSELLQPINEGSSFDLDKVPVDETDVLEDIAADGVLQQLAVDITSVTSAELLSSVHSNQA